MTVKISKAEISRSSGHVVVNTRSANTGFTPILGSLPFPASLLDDLAAEDLSLGYPEAYRTKSVALRNTLFDCFYSPSGFSIGTLHALHGIPLIDVELDRWLSDTAFVREKVSSMGIPNLGAFATGINWGNGAFIAPGTFDLKTLHPGLVDRVSQALFGEVLPSSRCVFARLDGNVEGAAANWNGTATNANDGTFVKPMRGPAGTVTVAFVQTWARVTYWFRFDGFAVEPQTRLLVFGFNIYNKGGDQLIYNNVPATKARTVVGTLNNCWGVYIRRSIRDYLGRNGTVGPTLTGSMGYVRHEIPENTDFGYLEANWGDKGGCVQIVGDETDTDGLFRDYGGLKHGKFYVVGMQPFFRGVHAQGPTTYDAVTREIRVSQEKWAFDWRGAELALLKDDLTPTESANLQKLRVLSCFNLTGTWTAPNEPLRNLDMWDDAQEAEIDLEAEIYAEATADNPQITFGQANRRASLAQTKVVHRIDAGGSREYIARVVITGNLVGNVVATSYGVDGLATVEQDRDLMLHAIKAGAELVFSQTSVTNDDAFYTLFDTTLSSLQDALASSRSGATSELDETVLFRRHLPSLGSEVDLKERSAFAIVNFSPSRKNLTDVAASGMVMMEHIRRRLID